MSDILSVWYSLDDIIEGFSQSFSHNITPFADFENKEIFYPTDLLINNLDIIILPNTDFIHGCLAIFT
ncbi:MAG TPA: hypothetical protein VHF08_05465 [Nitrososphaeraceae archaeon]|nr:hypothetical protein [Nitrososphaeraceae archaeon]